MQLPLSGEGPETELVTGRSGARAIGYVEAEDLLVWAEYSIKTLESSKRDGSQRRTILHLEFQPSDIVAVDR